jgi:chitin synthase
MCWIYVKPSASRHHHACVVAEHIRNLRKFMQRLRDTRYFTYIFISLWKMLCFFCCLLLILFLKGESVPNFFLLFTDAFSARQIVVTEVRKPR